MDKFNIKNIINYIKQFFLAIFNFILSLFGRDENTSGTSKTKSTKQNTKKQNIKEGNTTSNRDDKNINTINSTKKSYIDFDKEFKKVIESITGLEIKYATYTQTVEIEKVKVNVKQKVEAREEISYFTSKEDEVRFLEKTTLKEVELNKRLPIVKTVEKEIKKETKKEVEPKTISKDTKKEKVTAEVEITSTKKEIAKPSSPAEETLEEEKDIELEVIDITPLTNEQEEVKESIIEEDITITPIIVDEELEEVFEIDETIVEEIETINAILENPLTSEEEYDDVKERLAAVGDKVETFIVAGNVNEETKEKLKELKKDIDEQEKKVPETKKNEEKKEEELLQEELRQKEIRQINSLMQTIYDDNKMDMQDELIDNIEELNNMSLEQMKIVEKSLLKKRLRKAAKAIEPPLLLSLPFIRNKFFFGFTAGLFLHNHLNTIDSIYNRQQIEYNPLDETKYIKGSRAMEDAVSLNRNNFQRVEKIKEQYLERYPELAEDPDFVLPINAMESKLQKQEERLLKTSTRFDHTKKKQNNIYKKLVLPKKER